ncbi:ABC transporter substrate-binding protein [Psychromonas arctica]|uniref:urea ABC transporter substrate-binding protein n=1 Tax=Psychromonas arctica TaxID=168275 RepID=UPI002FD16B89
MKKNIVKSAFLCSAILGMNSAFAEVKVSAIYDITGSFSIFGVMQSNAVKLAIDDINAKGGLLGEKLKLITYDTQSELSKYTQYANTTVLKDRPAAVFGGMTSSSREAIRPIFRKADVPYFYSTLYEGGACDKQTFVVSPSASQQIKPLVEWAIKEYGPKMFIMAPDYNYGTISALWYHEYAKQFGGEVVGEEFLALTVTDYAPTIQKIQRAKPDFVVAIPVGPNQVGFLEQFSSAGLKENIPVVSSNYSTANEQVLLTPKASKGIVSSHVYFSSLDNPENKAFLDKWAKAYGEGQTISPEAVTAWNAVHLWAEAIEKSGSFKSKPVYAAMESGDINFKGPNGFVSVEPGSHHVKQNTYIAVGDDNYGFDIIKTFDAVAPSYENETCDLISNPKLVGHFTPEA